MGIWKCPYTVSYFQLWTYNSQNLILLKVKMPGFFSSWPTLAGPGVTCESVHNSIHRISEWSKPSTPCFQSFMNGISVVFSVIWLDNSCVLKQSVTPLLLQFFEKSTYTNQWGLMLSGYLQWIFLIFPNQNSGMIILLSNKIQMRLLASYDEVRFWKHSTLSE